MNLVKSCEVISKSQLDIISCYGFITFLQNYSLPALGYLTLADNSLFSSTFYKYEFAFISIIGDNPKCRNVEPLRLYIIGIQVIN